MTRLKLSDIVDERPVKLTIEISARLHNRLADYAVVLNGGAREGAPDPASLIAPMIERFIASDREFARARQRVRARQE